MLRLIRWIGQHATIWRRIRDVALKDFETRLGDCVGWRPEWRLRHAPMRPSQAELVLRAFCVRTASRLRRQLRSRQAHSPAVAGRPNEGEPARTVPDVRLYPAASATQDDCNSVIAHDNSTMKSLASTHLQASTVNPGL